MSTGKLVRHALVALVAIGSTALACETVHAAGCASECDLPTKWSQFTQIDFSVTTATVSYTHLDVYKRQVLSVSFRFLFYKKTTATIRFLNR